MKKSFRTIWTKTTAAGFASQSSAAAIRGLMAIDSVAAPRAKRVPVDAAGHAAEHTNNGMNSAGDAQQ
jgi:hypothetical protein